MARIRSLVPVFCFLLPLVHGTAVGAQPLPEPQQQSTNAGISGEITAIDTAAKTLTVQGPNQDGGVYTTTSYTTIMRGDKAVAFGDLKKGWRVAVTFDVENGKNVAKFISVVDEPK